MLARDGRVDGIDDGLVESRWVEQQLGRPVVKAFNNIIAAHLVEKGSVLGTSDRVALPVAGDDANAKATVMHLVDAIGFDPLHAGTTDESWRQQPGSPVYLKDADLEGTRRAIREANATCTPHWHATPTSPGSYVSPA